MTTTGVPRTADSSVAVPEEDRETSAAATASPRARDDRNSIPFSVTIALELRAVDGRRLDDVRIDLALAAQDSTASSIGGSSECTSMRRDPGSSAMRRASASRGGLLDVRELLDQRMPDVGHRHAVLAVELLLEREDHDHPVDVPCDVPHSPLPPRPHLRRDVIDDAQPELLAALRRRAG